MNTHKADARILTEEEITQTKKERGRENSQTFPEESIRNRFRNL